MKRKYLLLPILSILIISIFAYSGLFIPKPTKSENLDVFVGVDAAYDNLEEIKNSVDEVSSYTNTFVIGSTGITYDENKLNDACQYLYDKDMNFMIYMHPQNKTDKLDEQRRWVENARMTWGQHFLGLYAFDEVGGRQLDNASYRLPIETPDNYTDAADKWVNELSLILLHIRESPINSGNLPLFTSDYALYWFDYKGGYDVVFAQFGWNYSRQLNIGLDRGAATVQGKEWGTIITWTYNHPPYLESGDDLYQDMVLAYDNGAKYILVFDTNENYTHGVLEEEHLQALRRFWNYAINNPRKYETMSERVAFVLPEGYAYGFRGPNDKIWGFWEADNQSYPISATLGQLLSDYNTELDIIYEDGLNPIELIEYGKLIFWNGTTYEP